MTDAAAELSERDTVRAIARDIQAALTASGAVPRQHSYEPHPRAWFTLALGRALLLTRFTAPQHVSGRLADDGSEARFVLFTEDALILADVTGIGTQDQADSIDVRAISRSSLVRIDVTEAWYDPFDDEPSETQPEFALTYSDGTTLTLPLSRATSHAEWESLRALRASLLDDLAARA